MNYDQKNSCGHPKKPVNEDLEKKKSGWFHTRTQQYGGRVNPTKRSHSKAAPQATFTTPILEFLEARTGSTISVSKDK
jgi:hypothetical protein